MKGNIKIFGIIALSAVIVFSMTACPNEPSPPPEPKYFITVTGIPSTHDGKYGIVLLSQPGPSDPIYTAWSLRQKIKGTSYKFPLYNHLSSDPWSGSGEYRLNILIFQDNYAQDLMYSGIITQTSITETNTAIAWASFASRPVSKSVNLSGYLFSLGD